jgi:hypothetical protein
MKTALGLLRGDPEAGAHDLPALVREDEGKVADLVTTWSPGRRFLENGRDGRKGAFVDEGAVGREADPRRRAGAGFLRFRNSTPRGIVSSAVTASTPSEPSSAVRRKLSRRDPAGAVIKNTWVRVPAGVGTRVSRHRNSTSS